MSARRIPVATVTRVLGVALRLVSRIVDAMAADSEDGKRITLAEWAEIAAATWSDLCAHGLGAT